MFLTIVKRGKRFYKLGSRFNDCSVINRLYSIGRKKFYRRFFPNIFGCFLRNNVSFHSAIFARLRKRMDRQKQAKKSLTIFLLKSFGRVYEISHSLFSRAGYNGYLTQHTTLRATQRAQKVGEYKYIQFI